MNPNKTNELKNRIRILKKQHLGVEWFLPQQKRPFASSTVASSNLISLLGENGSTFQEVLTTINYDDEAKTIVEYFCNNGFANKKVSDYVR